MKNMKKIYLVIYSKESKTQFIKYFENVKEKEKFKNKIKFSKKCFIIEDSDDIIYVG